jgi:hypothetical protein
VAQSTIGVSALAGLIACSSGSTAVGGPDASGVTTGTTTGGTTTGGTTTGTTTGVTTGTTTGTTTSGTTTGVTTGTTTGGTTTGTTTGGTTTGTTTGGTTTGTTTGGTTTGTTTTGTTTGTTNQDGGATGGMDGGGTARDSSAGDAASGGDSGPPIVDLFNGTDLTGFLTYEASSTANNAPGTLLTGTAAEAIFTPEAGDAGGPPVIHVFANIPQGTTEPHYMLETVASYGHYNLWWQYKWGTKKYAPYTDLTTYPRDAGLMWAINTLSQVWPSSVEFQNKWGTTGDIFALYSQVESYGVPGSATSLTTYESPDAGGVETLVNGTNALVQHHRSADWEMTTLPDGGISTDGAGTDWNSCLLQVNGGAAVYTVNGHIVNQTLSVLDNTGKPVTSGPVAWQAEQAEVYYRNLQIQVLE